MLVLLLKAAFAIYFAAVIVFFVSTGSWYRTAPDTFKPDESYSSFVLIQSEAADRADAEIAKSKLKNNAPADGQSGGYCGTNGNSECCKSSQNREHCCELNSRSSSPQSSSQRDNERSSKNTNSRIDIGDTRDGRNGDARDGHNGDAADQEMKTERISDESNGGSDSSAVNTIQAKFYIRIFYCSIAGTSKRLALELKAELDGLDTIAQTEALSHSDIQDWDEHLVELNDKRQVYIFIVPSYEKVSSPSQNLLEILNDTLNDFRVPNKPLKMLSGCFVVGIGDREMYPDKRYCFQAEAVYKILKSLGPPNLQLVKIDSRSTEKLSSQSLDRTWDLWKLSVRDLLSSSLLSGGNTEILPSPAAKEISSSYRGFDDDDTISLSEEGEVEEVLDIIDMEDLGDVVKTEVGDFGLPMVAKDSRTFKSLTKQGYTIVGTHSGVKLCRWTKSALRGRGFCYKYSFYGIKSHLCMELTPSLACANKCTFCWRHGTNPVGTEWRWHIDPPELILDGALKGHGQKVKQLRGAPGIRPERFAEAVKPRHCALSLVGEPIFYPYINEFVSMLHERHISSFLVTNAQHPDALRKICKVTQLYVSIDASTKESLKKIDRPLFRDFWERLLECLDILSNCGQRTVFRLTLVKSANMDEIEQYCRLIRRGRPNFIEVKGVTYCGTTDNSKMTMADVPFYDDVVAFCVALRDKLQETKEAADPEYDICAEHAHSNCILLAQKSFFIGNQWHSHIDYQKFFELLESGRPFGPVDYALPTPEFALFGNGGFNPDDVRYYRKRGAESAR